MRDDLLKERLVQTVEDLQCCCKRPGKPWETCNVVANVPANHGRLAMLLQTSLQTVGDLQCRCKCPSKP